VYEKTERMKEKKEVKEVVSETDVNRRGKGGVRSLTLNREHERISWSKVIQFEHILAYAIRRKYYVKRVNSSTLQITN